MSNTTIQLCENRVNQIFSIVDEDPGEFVQIILDVKSMVQNITSDQLARITSVCLSDLGFNSTIKCVRKVLEVVGEDDGDIKDCHELLSEYDPVLESCKFWLEGISLSAIGFLGLCGNILAIIVLGRTKDSTRSKKVFQLHLKT